MANCPYGCGVNHRYGPSPTNCIYYPGGSTASSPVPRELPASLRPRSAYIPDPDMGSAKADADNRIADTWLAENADELDEELSGYPWWDETPESPERERKLARRLMKDNFTADDIRYGRVSVESVGDLVAEEHEAQEGAAAWCRDNDEAIIAALDEAADRAGVEPGERLREEFDRRAKNDFWLIYEEIERVDALGRDRKKGAADLSRIADESVAALGRAHQKDDL